MNSIIFLRCASTRTALDFSLRGNLLRSVQGSPPRKRSDLMMISIAGITVQQCPFKVCGSTIYTVDKLLLPPAGNLLKMLSASPQYSRFLDLVKATNLTGLVNKPATTVIVPTNQAFNNLDEKVSKSNPSALTL